MKRALVALSLVASLTGCNPKPTMAVGGVTMAGGLLLAVTPDNCDKELCLLGTNKEVGTAFVVLGAAIAAIGVIVLGIQQLEVVPQQPSMSHAPPAPFPVVATPPVEPPAPPVEPPRPPAKPLPALELQYTSPADRQFAIQTSAAARRGDCVAAIATAKHLSVDDRHRLATVDADYARCVEAQP